MDESVPARVEDLTPDYLNILVSALRPGVTVSDATITRVRGYGDADTALSVSTSNQISMTLVFGDSPSPPLPDRVLAKMSFPPGMDCANPFLDPLFENEVLFYNRLRPELEIETPLGLGGSFDPDTGRFILLMEDLGPKSPHINSMMDDDDVGVVQGVLETYAKLHARFWGSDRFATDLSWVQSQVAGSIEDMFDHAIKAHVVSELAREKFKAEFAQDYGMSEQEMFDGEKALKRHFSRMTPTVLHGDAHFANTYVLPDGTGGLIDWQVFTNGYFMFDVAYFLQTALSVAGRRKHEREMLAFYRDRLQSFGVRAPPDAETMWLEYRRALHHGFYLGWLTAPRENYGWEVMVLGNHRTKAACTDHDSARLIRDLM